MTCAAGELSTNHLSPWKGNTLCGINDPSLIVSLMRALSPLASTGYSVVRRKIACPHRAVRTGPRFLRREVEVALDRTLV